MGRIFINTASRFDETLGVPVGTVAKEKALKKVGTEYGTLESRTAELAKLAARTSSEQTEQGEFIRYYDKSGKLIGTSLKPKGNNAGYVDNNNIIFFADLNGKIKTIGVNDEGVIFKDKNNDGKVSSDEADKGYIA